jgi:hypothetical protein
MHQTKKRENNKHQKKPSPERIGVSAFSVGSGTLAGKSIDSNSPALVTENTPLAVSKSTEAVSF